MSQISPDPFASPSPTDPPDRQSMRIGPPAVAKWQIAYVILMMLTYLVLAVTGVALIIFRDTIAQDPDFEMGADEALVMGGIYAGLGVGLALLFLVGLFWRRGMGGWVFNLVLIALGMTSCCTWPATIPLLIYWIRDKDAIVGG